MPESHVNVGIGSVVVPVRNTVANHESLEVGLEHGIIGSILSIVLVDVVSKVGYVDAGVGLARKEEVVGLELWELLEPRQKGSQVVLA